MKPAEKTGAQVPVKKTESDDFFAPIFSMQSMINQMQSLMNRDFERFMGRFGRLPSFFTEKPFGGFAPGLNVTEKDNVVHIEAELPGLTDKDVKVSLQDHMLTIEGERKHEEEKKDERVHRREFSYGAFRRSVELPGDVDMAKAQASFKNGILAVDLPLTSPPQPAAKQIPIKNG